MVRSYGEFSRNIYCKTNKLITARWSVWVLIVVVLRQYRVCGLVVRVPGYTSRGPGFDSRRYQIFWEVVGLERGPLSLVSTTEELLGRNNSGSGLENREYCRGDPLRWPRDTLYPQKLTLTSPTSGGHSVRIVRLRTKATKLVCFLFLLYWDRKNLKVISLVVTYVNGGPAISGRWHFC
jgi:hypothetical protein